MMRAYRLQGLFHALVLELAVQPACCQATSPSEYDVVAASAAAIAAAEADVAAMAEAEVTAAIAAQQASLGRSPLAAPPALTTGGEPGAIDARDEHEGWLGEELAVPPRFRSRRLQADFNVRRRRTATSPPVAMVITNLAYVVDTWVIYELQLYLGDCFDKIPVPVFESAIMSTGNSQKFPSARDANAFDNNMGTNYTADCSRAQMNCIPEAVYIGLDITSMDEWDEAMDPNATYEEYNALQVKCIRFFQSDLPMNRADIIGVQELYMGGDAESANFKDGYTFETLMIFDDVPGGVWVRRPADRNQLWRISNMESTEERWTITEIELFSDIFCETPLIGGIFSSPSNDPVWGSPLSAFDGNHSSSWRADCQTYDEVAYQYGCRPLEAWIGMDFGEKAVEVRCFRILQRLHDPDAVVAEKPSFTRGIALEYWSGAFGEWKTADQYWAPGTTIADWGDEDSGPTLPSPFFGLGPGIWEDMRQPRQCAWRLENDEKTKGPWLVHELEFYPDNDCQGHRMTGEAISHMGADYQYNASLAFDQDSLLYYGWQAICTEGYEGSGPGACGKYEAWVGLYFRNQQVNVSCIRLMQAGKVDNIAPGVLLSFWTNTSWEPFYVHRDMGGGTWNRRPAAPWSMWRIYNDRPIENQWQINELRAYKDPMCLYPLTQGQSLTNGFLRYNQVPDNVFDGLLSTHWGADCEVCTEKGLHGYWIGEQLPTGALDAINMDHLVRCIKMWQAFTQENQVDVVKVDIWNGQDWILSPFSIHGIVSGGGGAGWMRAPAAYASKWRLKQADTWNMQWRLKEVEFYADTACSQRLPTPILDRKYGGGADVHLQSYVEQLSVVDLPPEVAHILRTETLLAVDGDLQTDVLMLHRPEQYKAAWYALDVLSQITWVRCIRLQQSELTPEQARSVTLELYDGQGNWSDWDPALNYAEIHFEELAGGGWQRRPAAAGTMWRIENGNFVPDGWVVVEVEFYDDTSCGGGVVEGDDANESWFSRQVGGVPGEPIASGYCPPDYDWSQDFAFDSNPDTMWKAQCAEVPRHRIPDGVNLEQDGCQVSEAWIGLDFNQTVRNIQCIAIQHIGYSLVNSQKVIVSKWDGQRWAQAWLIEGLGGTAWDRRPALPNTMWRLIYMKAREGRCKNELRSQYPRLWGVNELEFYTDDDCTQKVHGGRAISAGAVMVMNPTSNDHPDGYHMEAAADLDTDSVYAANCMLGWTQVNRTQADCRGTWLGLDFGNRAVEVRCVKLMQSRIGSSTCCDPAGDLDLERWNGTAWEPAAWRHDPPEGADPEAEPSRDLGANFKLLGECPLASEALPGFEERIWETRSRRDSEKCMVPLTGATALLGENACSEHARCVDAVTKNGECCPMSTPGTSSKENRCCCSYLEVEGIFVDETRGTDVQAILNLEYVISLVTSTMPYAGGAVFFFLFVFAQVLSKDALSQLEEFFHRGLVPGQSYKAKATRFAYWAAYRICYPVASWRHLLAYDEGYAGKAARWFCLPEGKRPDIFQGCRIFLWVPFGGFCGGILPWVGCGFLSGALLLMLSLGFALVVRAAKSPYHLDNPKDMELRAKVAGEELKEEGDTASAKDVVREFLAIWVLGMVYFLKFVFDLLVFRAQMISLGAIMTIDADRMIDIFPDQLAVLREPGMAMYAFLKLASQVMTSAIVFSVGIPMCQGSTTLIGSVSLIMVLAMVTRWLNYDFFGLFTASRQVLRTTRPECQRVFASSLVLICTSVNFAFVQLLMVLFSRSLVYANPFVESSWFCEFNDTFALWIGRGLLMGSSVIGIGFFAIVVNGHFMGQDYILRPVETWFNLHLQELDPDGAGEDGGWVRTDILMSVFPTIAGMWFDFWNVKGYLVFERSRVYAEQLRDPQPCMLCGRRHVKYNTLMTATARQVSLACQIIPYGVIVGKLAEYTNDPPLFYMGETLPCIRANFDNGERPTVSSGWGGLSKVYILIADGLSLVIDYVVPLCQRLISVALYGIMCFGTFVVTEENLMVEGHFVTQYALVLCMLKGAFEGFVPALLSFIIGFLFQIIEDMDEIVRAASATKRTLCGQVVSGASVGALLAVLPWFGGTTNRWAGAFMGFVLGYAFSCGTMLVNYFLEVRVLSVDSPPDRNWVPTMCKLGYAGALGVLIILSCPDVIHFRNSIPLGVMVICVNVLVLQNLFVTKMFAPDEDVSAKAGGSILGLIRLIIEQEREVSPTMQVLFGPMQLAAANGALAAGTFPSWLLANSGVYDSEAYAAGAFVALFGGIFAGCVWALAILEMMKRPSQLVATAAFWCLCVPLSFWNTLIAVGASSVLGAAIGSVLEQVVVYKVKHDHKVQLAKEAAAAERQRIKEEADARPDSPNRPREDKLAYAMQKAIAKMQAAKALAGDDQDNVSMLAAAADADADDHERRRPPALDDSVVDTLTSPTAALRTMLSQAGDEDSFDPEATLAPDRSRAASKESKQSKRSKDSKGSKDSRRSAEDPGAPSDTLLSLEDGEAEDELDHLGGYEDEPRQMMSQTQGFASFAAPATVPETGSPGANGFAQTAPAFFKKPKGEIEDGFNLDSYGVDDDAKKNRRKSSHSASGGVLADMPSRRPSKSREPIIVRPVVKKESMWKAASKAAPPKATSLKSMAGRKMSPSPSSAHAPASPTSTRSRNFNASGTFGKSGILGASGTLGSTMGKSGGKGSIKGSFSGTSHLSPPAAAAAGAVPMSARSGAGAGGVPESARNGAAALNSARAGATTGASSERRPSRYLPESGAGATS